MQTPARRSRRWIEDWRPEDADFWESGGCADVVRRLVDAGRAGSRSPFPVG